MKQRKIYLVGLSLILLILLSLAVFVSCTDKPAEGTQIFIQGSGAPRLTYVLGQDLDLSHGVLTVVEKGQERSLPLDNAEITVTGYDNKTLGKQTLTVTYKGLTTTFEITVIPRTVAENFESDYFVGDTFDNTKGRLRIARDDGSTFNVNLNSEKISLKAFDASKEGTTTILVTYKDGDTSYECSFDVTVHKAAKVSLTPPKKAKYASHETELDLSGGYLTVEAAAPSTFSKFVNLTPDMISGYDPSKVTIADRHTPVTQVLTITYAGQQFEFPVEISYSTVYLVEAVAKDLAHLDWTQDEVPEYSDEQGELALDAIKSYLELSPADRALIDKETLMAVVRPATVYLNTAYYDASLIFADAFTVTPEGYINLVGKSYAAVEDALKHLKNSANDFNATARILCTLKDEFAEEIIVGTLTFAEAITAHTTESLEQITPIFEYMLSTYDALKDVPDDWSIDTLKNYETQITTAVSKIQISNYVGWTYNQFYDAISSWRTNDDYFDIIYSYYYYVKDNGQHEILSSLWQKLPAPGIMNDWYTAYIRALTEANNMAQYGTTQGFLYDASGLIYYYHEALRLAEEVKATDNELYLGLFELLEAEEAMEIHLRRGTHGYIFHMGEALGLESVEYVWEQYLALLDVYLTKPGNTLVSEHGAKFEAVFDALADLPATELYAFISSINFLYDSARGQVLVLDCSVRPYNTLMTLLGTYYREILPSDELDNMFIDLFIAMENFALYGVKETALTDFQTVMGKLKDAYGKLSATDKALFDQHFGTCYTKYLAVYDHVTAQSVDIPNGWSNKFNELQGLLDTFDAVYTFITSQSTSNVDRSRATPLLFALYERAYRVYGEIAYSDDLAVSTALATKTYTANDVNYTLERRFFGARGMFVTLTVSSGLESVDGVSEMTWDVYSEAGLQSFLADVAYLLLAEYQETDYKEGDLPAIMAAFRSFSPEKKVASYKLSINLLYYAGIERYYTASLGEQAGKVVSKLLQAEIAYAMYEYDHSDVALNDFKTHMAEAIKLHDGLADKAAFDEALGEIYNDYKDLYNA